MEMEIEDMNIKIFEQLNNQLIDQSKKSDIIKHNLEKGLGNEEILRNLIKDFLPDKYGVAKGKVINEQGKSSKHCDIIVYDSLNCPKLFIDENRNQILPIEGVYAVLEVKSTLTSKLLKEAFENLYSVYKLKKRTNNSTNNYLELCPPSLSVIAFRTQISLKKIKKCFTEFNNQYVVNKSFHSYSKKSPGFKEITGKKYLVGYVSVLNEGEVFHRFKGDVLMADWKAHTLGIYLTNLFTTLDKINLPRIDVLGYFSISRVINENKLMKLFPPICKKTKKKVQRAKTRED